MTKQIINNINHTNNIINPNKIKNLSDETTKHQPKTFETKPFTSSPNQKYFINTYLNLF